MEITRMSSSIVSMHRPLSVAIAMALAGGTIPALAQDIKVEVIGTNIRRVEGESALPVTIMTREEIERTGAQSAADLLQFIAANNSAGAISVNQVIGAQTYSVQTA